MVLLCTFNIENDDEAMDFEVCRDMPILMPYFQPNPVVHVVLSDDWRERSRANGIHKI